MTKSINPFTARNAFEPQISEVPKLRLSKIAIVARDYSESNGNSDFSKSIETILEYCDSQGCDSVLFSLFTILECIY